MESFLHLQGFSREIPSRVSPWIQSGNIGFSRPAIRRVIFEPSVMRRIMRRRNYYAVGKSCFAPAVVCYNGMRNNGSWRYSSFSAIMTSIPFAASTSSAPAKCRYGECMCVHTKEKRTIYLLLFSIKTNGLSNGEYMPFVECFVECRTAVPGCSKHNALRRYRRIRYIGIISRYKLGTLISIAGSAGFPAKDLFSCRLSQLSLRYLLICKSVNSRILKSDLAKKFHAGPRVHLYLPFVPGNGY